MPSNANYVCCTCRKSRKGQGVCPRCHKDMVSIGKRWRTPTKNDDKAWEFIENWLSKYIERKP
jgi:hypothetical protein